MNKVTVDTHPAAGLDQLLGAVFHVREEWGDYGYRVAYQGSDMFAVIHRDMTWDDPATFHVDRYGEVYTP